MNTALEFPSDLQPAYLRVLNDTATLLLSDTPPDEVARQVFQRLAPLLDLDSYFHYLVSPDGRELELQSCAGAPPEALPTLQRLQFGQAVCGTVAQRSELMYVPGVQQRADHMTDYIRGIGIRCYLCQPLIANGELLGTFSFGSKRRSSYTDEECQLLFLVAQQVAIAASRRKQAERLRQMEKLAVAGRIAATVSHEINNPLESISNLLFLLQKEPLTEHATELLSLAIDEVVRISELTQQALGVHRPDSEPREVPLRDVVEKVVRVLGEIARARRINVAVEIPAALIAVARVSELQQILLNILKNALEAVGQNGTVKVGASIRADGKLELTVTDSGPGVPPEVAARIFEPFFTTKQGLGTGLGLWVTQQLVRKNNGDIRLHSSVTPPTGTRVQLTLPAAYKSKAAIQ